MDTLAVGGEDAGFRGYVLYLMALLLPWRGGQIQAAHYWSWTLANSGYGLLVTLYRCPT